MSEMKGSRVLQTDVATSFAVSERSISRTRSCSPKAQDKSSESRAGRGRLQVHGLQESHNGRERAGPGTPRNDGRESVSPIVAAGL